MKAFDDLTAAVGTATAELEKVKGLVTDARSQITDLLAAVAADTIDPVAVQALTSNLSTTVADVENTLNPPPAPPASTDS